LFTDPLPNVTINAVAQVLPRTPVGSNYGVFTKEDGLVKVTISSRKTGNRTRRVVKIDHAKIAADPLLAGVNVKAAMSVYLVTDLPLTGFTVTEQKVVTDAFMTYLTASSGAKMLQLLGGED